MVPRIIRGDLRALILRHASKRDALPSRALRGSFQFAAHGSTLNVSTHIHGFDDHGARLALMESHKIR